PLVAGPHAVDDAPAPEVVRGELDAHAVSRVHANPEAAHLAGGVAKRLVAVVELDPEHAVPERLDDLAGHLDLLFFLGYLILLSMGGGLTPAARVNEINRPQIRSRPEGPFHPPAPRTRPSRPHRASCSRFP